MNFGQFAAPFAQGRSERSRTSASTSSRSSRNQKKCKTIECSFPIPCLERLRETFIARFGLIADETTGDLGITSDPESNMLRIPVSAAVALGFDINPPCPEDGMFFGNVVQDPLVNYLPAAVQSPLYTFVNLPTEEAPWWFLRALQPLTNSKLQWKNGDIFFIAEGPYSGGRLIQAITISGTIVVYVGPKIIDGYIKLCFDARKAKLQCVERWEAHFAPAPCCGTIGCDGNCKNRDSDCESSDSEDC